MEEKFIGYECSVCGQEYSLNENIDYVCPKDGGNLNVLLDYKEIKNKYQISDIVSQTEISMWRYLPLLPVSDPGYEFTPFRNVGYTANYFPTNLSKKYGFKQLWVKDESKNPTASFKDRASALVLARAKEIKADVVVTASTGNAGAALAGMAASVGHKAVIFAPKTAPVAKVAQLLVFGAEVILVDGNYDQAFDLSLRAAEEFGWYCRNTGFNPFTAEGKKTAAFEIWESIIIGNKINDKPINIFVSVGDGNIISGIHKGFIDLYKLGWLDLMPRIFGVQAEGSAAISNAFIAGNEIINPVSASTIADSISVDLPRDGLRALRASTQTNGSYILVEDKEILSAIAELGVEGIFAEPAGATSFAGFKKAINLDLIQPDEPVVILNTGSGLKDINSAMKAVPEANIIDPTFDALISYINAKK